MNKQKFLGNHGMELFSVWRRPELVERIVILVAGFGHPACDKDYLMTNIAQRIAARDTLVIQYELRGHGESFGDIAAIDEQAVCDDLLVLLDCLKSEVAYNAFPITIVTRGAMGNCISQMYGKLEIDALLVIAPIILSKQLTERIIKDLDENDYLTYAEYVKENTHLMRKVEKMKLIEAMGAHHSNMLGQNFPALFIRENISSPFNFENGVCCFCWDKNAYRYVEEIDGLPVYETDFKDMLFSRDPIDQYNLISLITDMILMEGA